MKVELTCIVCPMGCTITVEKENNQVLSVDGNTCPRGEKYARTECTHPERTLTSIVRCTNNAMLSVKTNKTIPKEKIFECMNTINGVVAKLPVRVGDIIIKNINGIGVDVVATKNMN